MFDRLFKQLGWGSGLISLWYHFAIMFEALFILTTLDAGTRVGRFILQDLLGQFWPKLGDTSSWTGNVIASGGLVAAWGYFLYQGALDPEGIAKSLWPIFGIANQLLAVIAFALGTTILIKMGRTKYAWCTLVPLVWLVIVTFSAGYMKVFSANAAGFLPAIESTKGILAAKAIAGVPLTEKQTASYEHALTNAYVDVALVGLFLLLVAVIVVGCCKEWFSILYGQKLATVKEAPYVELTEVA
jgi:carbon starvation protein